MEPSHPRTDSVPIHVVLAPRNQSALMNYPG